MNWNKIGLAVFIIVTILMVACVGDGANPSTILREVRFDQDGVKNHNVSVYTSVRTGKCYIAVHDFGLVEADAVECNTK